MHPRLHSLAFAVLGCAVVFPIATASAETGSGTLTTESGATITEPIDTSLDRDRQRRLEDFKPYQYATNSTERAYRTAIADYRLKRKENRVRCLEALRRSNRDEQLKTTLGCYRAELTLDRELNRKEREYLASIPQTSYQIRQSMLAPVDALHEALTSFITAIDKNVFETMESLKQAKQNLHKNYRLPAAEALAIAKADRSLYWVISMKDLATTAWKDNDPLRLESITSCLTRSENLLRQVLLPEETRKRQAYLQGSTELKACMQQITGTTDETAAP